MSGIRRWSMVAAVVCLVMLPVGVTVQSGDDARRPANKQWPAVSGDWGNTRHSTLNQITTQNITKLGAAWTSQKFDTPAGARTMPLVHDGLMFLTAPPSVYALDAKTGATGLAVPGGSPSRAWVRLRAKAWPSATGSCSSDSPTRA